MSASDQVRSQAAGATGVQGAQGAGQIHVSSSLDLDNALEEFIDDFSIGEAIFDIFIVAITRDELRTEALYHFSRSILRDDFLDL